MPNIFQRIRDFLPYMAAAIALVTGYNAYLHVSFAREDGRIQQLLTRSMRWEETWGTIERHDIAEETSGRFSHMPVTHYYARASFSYDVGGQSYTNDRICLTMANCGLGTKLEDAETLLAGLAVGSRIQVFYDPASPEDSSLYQGSPEAIARMRGNISAHWNQGIVFGLITLVLIYFAIKRAKEFQSGKE